MKSLKASASFLIVALINVSCNNNGTAAQSDEVNTTADTQRALVDTPGGDEHRLRDLLYLKEHGDTTQLPQTPHN